eukprot:2361098-Pleurochrysis_carterae.AAC.1
MAALRRRTGSGLGEGCAKAMRLELDVEATHAVSQVGRARERQRRKLENSLARRHRWVSAHPVRQQAKVGVRISHGRNGKDV